jgi:methylated-DNA-[protein]-cysteine S-methyltransferase
MSETRFFDYDDSPLGEMLFTASAHALTAVHFVGDKYFPRIDHLTRRSMPLFEHAKRALRAYFAGEDVRFDFPLGPEGTPFQQRVWSEIAKIPYGETITYGTLAARTGRPAAVRAAGAATGRNPLTIIVPCHRIVGADGSLTGYAGGLARKRALLSLERTKDLPLFRAA